MPSLSKHVSDKPLADTNNHATSLSAQQKKKRPKSIPSWATFNAFRERSAMIQSATPNGLVPRLTERQQMAILMRQLAVTESKESEEEEESEGSAAEEDQPHQANQINEAHVHDDGHAQQLETVISRDNEEQETEGIVHDDARMISKETAIVAPKGDLEDRICLLDKEDALAECCEETPRKGLEQGGKDQDLMDVEPTEIKSLHKTLKTNDADIHMEEEDSSINVTAQKLKAAEVQSAESKCLLDQEESLKQRHLSDDKSVSLLNVLKQEMTAKTLPRNTFTIEKASKSNLEKWMVDGWVLREKASFHLSLVRNLERLEKANPGTKQWWYPREWIDAWHKRKQQASKTNGKKPPFLYFLSSRDVQFLVPGVDQLYSYPNSSLLQDLQILPKSLNAARQMCSRLADNSETIQLQLLSMVQNQYEGGLQRFWTENQRELHHYRNAFCAAVQRCLKDPAELDAEAQQLPLKKQRIMALASRSMYLLDLIVVWEHRLRSLVNRMERDLEALMELHHVEWKVKVRSLMEQRQLCREDVGESRKQRFLQRRDDVEFMLRQVVPGLEDVFQLQQGLHLPLRVVLIAPTRHV